MSSFDPTKLGQRAAEPRTRAERVVMAVESYETPPNGPHFAVGHKLDDGELVRVRLNTIQERVGDTPNADADKIKSLYVSGKFHRDTIADKAKAGITLMTFDDARRIPSDDGVQAYRAHWPNTMSTDPRAEVKIAMGAIVLRDEVPQDGAKARPAQGRVELLHEGFVLNDQSRGDLERVLSNRDEQGRNRDPLLVFRAIYEGQIVAVAKVRAERDAVTIYDQSLGEDRQIRKPANAERSMTMLLEGSSTGIEGVDRGLDRARALLAGALQHDEPKFRDQNDRVVGEFQNLYYGAKSGQLTVEVLAGEVIEMGKDTRAQYVGKKDRGTLAAYQIEEPREDGSAARYQGYVETVVAVRRHDDGDPYVVFADSLSQWPKPKTIFEVEVPGATPSLDAGNDKPAAAAKREPEREAAEEEAPAP